MNEKKLHSVVKSRELKRSQLFLKGLRFFPIKIFEIAASSGPVFVCKMLTKHEDSCRSQYDLI